MASGADVIYQATFFDGTWRGHADFLQRVDDPDRPSVWGPWHYEVADTKLARHVKASAVLQICSYVDQLERIQGVRPEWMHVALGGSARAVERLRVDDFMAYYRGAKQRFLATVSDPATVAFPPASTYPEPVDHCDVCRWAAECAARRRADDHLSLVAGISGRQRRPSRRAGIDHPRRRSATCRCRCARGSRAPAEAAMERVHEQARIQLEGRRASDRPLYELLLPEAGRPARSRAGSRVAAAALARRPVLRHRGRPVRVRRRARLPVRRPRHATAPSTPFWSRDDAGEFTPGRRAAGLRAAHGLLRRAAARADPDLHIYHYAPYEPTALKRLMGRYGTREDEVDDLLRGGVLVDLLRVVRQSLRASVESYSIKKMEAFYGFTREIDLRDAGSSIVAFEQWLELGEGERPAADHLERIERYNRDDVVSNRQLRDWLEGAARRAGGADRPGRPATRSPRADTAGGRLRRVAGPTSRPSSTG